MQRSELLRSDAQCNSLSPNEVARRATAVGERVRVRGGLRQKIRSQKSERAAVGILTSDFLF